MLTDDLKLCSADENLDSLYQVLDLRCVSFQFFILVLSSRGKVVLDLMLTYEKIILEFF